MAKTFTQNHNSINEAGIRPPSIAAILMGWVGIMRTWHERHAQRRALSALEDHHLKDIGLSYEQARREARKPFWKR